MGGKLYFRHGAVGSAKTLNLLAVVHKYESQNKRVLLAKPLLDNRFGHEIVASRAGLQRKADILLDDAESLDLEQFKGVHCLIVDECQFVSRAMVDRFRLIADRGVPVICYGLRTDYRTNLFAGSQRLFEVADSFEEIKTTCLYCNAKATTNLKLLDGVATLEGPQVDLGMEEKYVPACSRHYHEKLEGVKQPKAQQDQEKEQKQDKPSNTQKHKQEWSTPTGAKPSRHADSVRTALPFEA